MPARESAGDALFVEILGLADGRFSRPNARKRCFALQEFPTTSLRPFVIPKINSQLRILIFRVPGLPSSKAHLRV